jgi:hypothetical protein
MLGRFPVAANDAETEHLLTDALERARSGLRRDVAALLESFEGQELLVPIAKNVADVPDGEQVELEQELKLSPHLLPDASGEPFAALFSHTDPLEPIVDALGWTTEGEPLKVCRLPARVALEVAQNLLGDSRVRGLVIDPGAPSELGLTRAELTSLLAGRPIPLLGYVENIPEELDRTLIAEAGDPPPPGLVSALDAWLAATDAVSGYRLDRTFNPDRDLEPHLTLTLQVSADADRRELFQGVTSAVANELPPPGYLDVLFET